MKKVLAQVATTALLFAAVITGTDGRWGWFAIVTAAGFGWLVAFILTPTVQVIRDAYRQGWRFRNREAWRQGMRP